VKTPKVRLYIRVRLPDGRDAFVDPVWIRNRTLRQSYALIKGQPEHHAEGFYYLRFLRDGKRVWHRVGQDTDVAITALRNTEHDLQSVALGRTVPTPVADPQASASSNPSAPKPVAEVQGSATPVVATAIVASIGNGAAFRKGREFAAWMGLLPKQHSTGGKARLYGISKRGNSYLRKILIHGARAVVLRSKRDRIAMGAWMTSLETRAPRNVLIVATAHKLARIAWAVLSTGQDYRAVPEAVTV